MLFPSSPAFFLALVAFALGGVVTWIAVSRLYRVSRSGAKVNLDVQTVVERVRAVGKLVGLEVRAKEIATATAGWAWMPPLLLTQARLAMIFNFEKQYTVNLASVGVDHVEDLGNGRFRLSLPAIEGCLRLIDITPYDIQSAKVLGLLDVVAMTADRQKDLMKRAQQQAAELYETNDERYLFQARVSVERHLRSLLDLFGVEIELAWADEPRERSLRMPETVRELQRAVAQLPAAAGAA